MSDIFQKFTTHSKNALRQAFSFALNSGHKTITPQHLLYGLSLQKGSIAAQFLAKAKIESKELKNLLTKQLPVQSTLTQISFAANTKKLLEKAFLIASLNQHKYIGTEHLLASIITSKDEAVINLFQQKNVNLLETQRQINTILNSTSKFPDLTATIDYLNEREKASTDFLPEGMGSNQEPYQLPTPQTLTRQPSVLDIFATNLTDSSVQKNIDPVIGRRDEIDRLIQILCRRRKNNPLLLGDPGVGKTAIVEGLAKKIIQGDVPEVLINKIIYALDLSLVVAGTSFRGEFENRLKQIINEVKRNPNIILFIDEIHNIIGIGAAAGSMDAANILKPALARGEIRLIGATTMEGYKKQIESDPAFDRRFQVIQVAEPTVEKTVEILLGIKNNYEFFHQVKISNQAITAAANLGERYIPDRFLPDKAIDLIDEAASAIKIKNLDAQALGKIRLLEDRLKNIQDKKQQAVVNEKFSLALKYRQQETEILTQLKSLKNKKVGGEQKILKEITQKDIAQIIAKMTGVPVSDLILTEKKQLLGLEKVLAKKIIDQDEAISSLAEFIRRSKTGITAANRPIGSFIFLGPSGVGKTETAKVLAETVFGSLKSLIRIDMSEFAESFNISKLIGAPAGYVGYKEGAKLTDAIKRQPYSVVLFDEIEKAHPQVFNLLLQILEDGQLSDGTGKNVNFKNSIIIMTSNLGSESFNQQAALGFQLDSKNQKVDLEKSWQETRHGVLKKLKDKFPPEFLSRIDKIIVFKPLNSEMITKIAKLQLAELTQRLEKQGIKIEVEPKVAKFIAKISYSPETGARAIRKTIQELIESKIANRILSTPKIKGKKIIVKIKDNKIII